MTIDPQPDELVSSWLHRLAIVNGIAPRPFAGVLGLGGGMWSPRLDLQLPRDVAVLLGGQTGVPHEAISAMTMTGWALTPLLLPLRENARRNRSTWMQFCSLCLADEAPHFHRQWRLASRISCFVHGCGLRDRCPACHAGIAAPIRPT
ncbi:TniQ family protein [Mesorhizobium sp. M0435]|uniref:TniQ family protein n=1 Tax=Mesorhizobium sp. M0435 TaxID=2956944 RepID=UPI0033364DE7